MNQLPTVRRWTTWRLTGLALACLVTVGLGTLTAPLWAQSGATTGVVNTEDTRLNMRSEPRADAPIVAKLDPQTAVTILATSADGDWLQVEVAGVGTGWVAAEFVTTAAGAATTPTPTPERESVEESSVAAPRIGILGMISPDATATKSVTPTVEVAPTVVVTPKAEVTVTVAATATAPVALVLLPTPTPAPNVTPQAILTPTAVAATPTIAPTTTATVAATQPDVPTAVTQPARMNVRGGPSTNFPVVGSVNGGTALVITGATPAGDWYRVEMAGVESAWVFASLTTVIGPAADIVKLTPEELPVEPTPSPQAAAAAVSPPVVGAPPPAGSGYFGYGVQAHMLAGEAGNALTSVSNMGFNWVKQQVQWKLFQPAAGPVGYGELGGIVNEAGNRGISVLFSVVNAPDWAREPGFDGSVGGPPADPATYAAFVGGMAGEFCGTSLKAIEIWNEQNLHYEWGNRPLDPAEYMNLLRPAYAAIKAACPQMLVISGALTPAGSNPPFAMDDFAYLEGMYQNGLKDYADGIGAHPSGYNVPATVRWEEACGVIQGTGNSFNGACDTPHHSWSFRSTMEGYRNIMVVYGDAEKRVWPTEFGWAAGGAFDPRYAYANDNSFDEQAAWTVEAYTLMRDWGWVGPAFLWNLNFRVVADGTEKAQWGIVRNDYTPLPVYDALRGMGK